MCWFLAMTCKLSRWYEHARCSRSPISRMLVQCFSFVSTAPYLCVFVGGSRCFDEAYCSGSGDWDWKGIRLLTEKPLRTL